MSVSVAPDAAVLLDLDGVQVSGPRRSSAQEWARSGAMALTGRPAGPPLPARGQPASAARGAALVVEALSAHVGARVRLDGGQQLGERAALMGSRRRGRTSCGGATRLLRAQDGWVAVSLARPDDRELLPALIAEPVPDDGWAALTAWACRLPASEVALRAQELGIPSGALPADGPDAQQRARPSGPVGLWSQAGGGPAAGRAPRVVDLSSLWAGPLCAHVLGAAGAEVVKVESPGRPDGSRRGSPAFFDLLHAGHRAVCLDLAGDEGRRQLLRLVRSADVVLEASRASASARLGLDPAEVVRERPGLTWVSITAYGRTGPWADRVGFGDDVAVAGGLVADVEDGPVFAGDAIADPLTGLHAAVAALAGMVAGGGVVDLAMRDVVAAAAAPVAAEDPADAPAPPVARVPRGRGPALGADTGRYVAA